MILSPRPRALPSPGEGRCCWAQKSPALSSAGPYSSDRLSGWRTAVLVSRRKEPQGRVVSGWGEGATEAGAGQPHAPPPAPRSWLPPPDAGCLETGSRFPGLSGPDRALLPAHFSGLLYGHKQNHQVTRWNESNSKRLKMKI